jgi:glycosyltransferase involved in cell wall biosynthesis
MFLLLINTNKKWGGGEIWFRETAKALIQRGFHITIIVTAKSSLENYALAAGIPVIPAKRSPFWQIVHFFGIKKMFRHEPPDFILVNSGIDLMHACIIKKAMAKSTLLFRRGLDKAIKNSFFNRLLYKNVDFFIANSKATAKTLQQSFPWLSREKIQIIYNPITINPVPKIPVDQLRQKYHIKNGIPILGIIGRLTYQKGHTILFNALKKVLGVQPETMLLIIGDGELKYELIDYTRKNKIEKKCLFLGHQNEIVPYYLLCDIVIIPSLFEGFCFTAVEAQYLQIPVIVSNISSLPEVILEGKSGLLFKKGDSHDLAKKIIYLLQNPLLRKQMGCAGKQFVIRKFDNHKTYDKMEYLLRDFTNKN